MEDNNEYNESLEENDSLEDKYLYELDKAVESGNYKIIEKAIIDYNGLINQELILLGRNLHQELICEEFNKLNL